MSEQPAFDPTPLPRSVADRVLKRAIELQGRYGEMVPTSLVYEIARELDVHPEYVRIALAQVQSDPPDDLRIPSANSAPPPSQRAQMRRRPAGQTEFTGTVLLWMAAFLCVVVLLVLGSVLAVQALFLPPWTESWVAWVWVALPPVAGLAGVLWVAGLVYEVVGRIVEIFRSDDRPEDQR